MSICKYYTLFCVLKENFFSDLFAGLKPYRQYTEKVYLSSYLSNYYLHYPSEKSGQFYGKIMAITNYALYAMMMLLFKTPVYMHFIPGYDNLLNKALKDYTLLIEVAGIIKDVLCVVKDILSFLKT